MIMRKNNWKTTAIVALLSISMVLPTTSGSAAAAFAVTPRMSLLTKQPQLNQPLRLIPRQHRQY